MKEFNTVFYERYFPLLYNFFFHDFVFNIFVGTNNNINLLRSHQIFEFLGSTRNNLKVVLGSLITSCLINLEYKESKTRTCSPYTNSIIGCGDWNCWRHGSTKDVTEEKNCQRILNDHFWCLNCLCIRSFFVLAKHYFTLL